MLSRLVFYQTSTFEKQKNGVGVAENKKELQGGTFEEIGIADPVFAADEAVRETMVPSAAITKRNVYW